MENALKLGENRGRILAAIGSCCAMGAATAIVQPQLFIPAAMIYGTLSTLFLIRQDWAIYALLLASLCTAVSLELGQFTVRPDQAVAITVLPSVFLLLGSGKRDFIRTELDALIILYLFCNVFSSLVNSPDPAMSFQKCALLAVTFLGYFLTTQLIRTRRILNRVLFLLLVVGSIEAIYGIVSVLLFTKGVNAGGAHAPFGDLYARGTFLEGNIFGSFQMMMALILISFLFSKEFASRRGLICVALAVVMIALMMSFTRAAWVSFVFGFLVYLLVFQKEKIRRQIRRLPVFLLGCLLVLSLAYGYSVTRRTNPQNLFDVYLARLVKVTDYKSRTASNRLRVWAGAVQYWKLNPILGNGTDTIKVLARGTLMPKFGEDHWIPNSMLLALHDTGLIGLVVFLSIQIAFLSTVRRALRQNIRPFYRAILRGFFVAFLAIQFAYLITNGFWLLFIWVFMGIGMSCARLAVLDARERGLSV